MNAPYVVKVQPATIFLNEKIFIAHDGQGVECANIGEAISLAKLLNNRPEWLATAFWLHFKGKVEV